MDFPPADVIDFLLEAYMDSVHWFMLIIHEPSLRAELKVLMATGHVRKDRIPFLVLVLVVIATGARYAAAEEMEQRCPGHDLKYLRLTLIRKAEEMLLDVFDNGDIEAVQISILLSSYYLYDSRPKRALALLGTGLKAAQGLGLSNEARWKVSDPMVTEIWKRIWWALYVCEVYVPFTLLLKG